MKIGLILMSSLIKDTDNTNIIVYKPVGIGLCEYKNGHNYFYSGKYAKQEIIEVILNRSARLVSLSMNTENIFCFNNNSVDQSLEKYYEKEYENTYIRLDFDAKICRTITDMDLIEKCRIAFGDDIEDLVIPAEDSIDTNEDETENSFSTYQIEEKYQALKEYVYGQDEQLKQILSCVIKNVDLANSMYHQDEIASLKSNILLLGQTGVGKTLIIKQIAKLFNIPYVLEDATRYTRNGWAGEDIENMIRNLYVASGESLTRAESGILIIDEFDKLCNRNEHTDVSTTSVQQGLVKLIEGTKINISKNNHTNVGGFIFDTSKLTIILLGAFDGIDKIIQKRTNAKKIGFNNINETVVDKSIQIEDLIEYGIISEIAGRMSNIIELNKPNENDLKNAFLYSKSSSLTLLEKYLKDRGIKIEFDESFIDVLVRKAITLKTGYRALNQILNNVVENEMFDIMANKKKVLSLTSDKVK